MRVTWVIPAFLPARGYGGPIEKLLRLAPALREQGVEGRVLTSTLGAPGAATLAAGRATVAGLEVWRLPTPVALGWAPWPRWSLPGPDPDVLHVIGAWNGLSYQALDTARAGRVVVWEPAGMAAIAGRHRRLKRLASGAHAAWARQSAGLIWTSEAERAEAPAALGGVRSWLRPNPAPAPATIPRWERAAARDALGLPATGPLWGYLGRIAPRKGLDTLLAAWQGAGSPGTLVAAGPVEDAALAARWHSAGPRVRLLPALDAERRWAYLQALDALVLVPPFGENFGNVVLEAAACGTPALLSPAVGAGAWLAGHGVEVVRRGELVARLRAGLLPAGPAHVPDDLQADAVAARQWAIYREAARPRSRGNGR